MLFLPLPLDKTMDMVEEIEDLAKGKLALLSNPEMYIIVNSKSKKTIWQSLVSLDKLKAAVRRLKATNWLYVNIDESSLDEASQHVVKTVSEATSTMLEKVSSDEVSAYQLYTARQLNSKQSSLPDIEHYKLIDVKEDPLSNKFKYLDVLCFPTLFPTGRFGESHPRQQRIIPSKFVKSRLINKDECFRKKDQYVFYLFWQKEIENLLVASTTCSKAHGNTQCQSGTLLTAWLRMRNTSRKVCPQCFRTCMAPISIGTCAEVRSFAW